MSNRYGRNLVGPPPDQRLAEDEIGSLRSKLNAFRTKCEEYRERIVRLTAENFEMAATIVELRVKLAAAREQHERMSTTRLKMLDTIEQLRDELAATKENTP